MNLKIGTRGSLLAKKQTEDVMAMLAPFIPGAHLELVEIQTQGDVDLTSSFQQMNSRSVFTKELDDALVAGRIDLAVHSLKDLPSKDAPDLTLALVTHVMDARDVWISKNGKKLKDLPPDAKIGTSSIRRETMLHEISRGYRVQGLRGNLSTRMKKLHESDLEGMILAAAGILRLGWEEHITEYLPANVFVPAVGQGMIGIVTRKKDVILNEILEKLRSPVIWSTATLQRKFMEELNGGCRVPLGFWIDAHHSATSWKFYGYLSNAKATKIIRHEMLSSAETAPQDLYTFVNHFKNEGADEIIRSLRA